MTQEEIDEQFDQTSHSAFALEASPSSSSAAVPIPLRTRNPSSDEVEDPNLIFGRTLPSSLSDIPQMPFSEEIINNRSPSPPNQHNSPRLDEIAEEDEGTMSSPSTNPTGQPQNNGSSSLHELSSSSASASDNDDDVVPIGLLPLNSDKQTSNPRVKGKEVVRLENGRENIS